MDYFNELSFVWCLTTRPEDARVFQTIFNPSWLKDPALQAILGEVYKFTKEFGIPPTIKVLDDIFKKEDEIMYTARYKRALDQMKGLNLDLSEQVYTIDLAKNVAICRSLELMMQDIRFQTKLVGFEGKDVLKDVNSWINQFSITQGEQSSDLISAWEMLIKDSSNLNKQIQVPTGFGVIDDWTFGGLRSRQLGIFMGATGMGKCLSKDTEIISSDGKFKKVQDIQVGDLLMGPDSKPRKVLGVTKGYGPLYKITPIKGEPFICNENHVLSLQATGSRLLFGNDPNQLFNIELKDYLKLSRSYKHRLKLWRTGVDFPEKELPFEPYVVGFYLGDGTKSGDKLSICINGDDEKECLGKFFSSWAKKKGLKINKYTDHRNMVEYRIHNNWKENKFRSLVNNNLRNGLIPEIYLINSRVNRKQLLAGLVDSDGWVDSNCIGFIFKNKLFCEQIAFLARSLGYGVSAVKTRTKTIKSRGFSGTYYSIYIYGIDADLPCKLKRKQIKPRKQIKNPLKTGFKIELVGNGEYYGFELDKDKLFLLKDFTVSHNSAVLLNIVFKAAIQDEFDIWFVTNEMSLSEQSERLLSRISGVPTPHIQQEASVVDSNFKERWNSQVNKRLRITSVNSDLSTSEIESMMIRWASLSGWKPQLLVLDFMERMKPNDVGYNRSAEWQWLGAIAKDLVRFSRQHNMVIWTACQTNRSGYIPAAELNIAMAQASTRHFQEAAMVIGIRKVWGDDSEEAMELKPLKNRHGKSSVDSICLKCNLETMYISETQVKKMINLDTSGEDEDNDSYKANPRRKRANKV